MVAADSCAGALGLVRGILYRKPVAPAETKAAVRGLRCLAAQATTGHKLAEAAGILARSTGRRSKHARTSDGPTAAGGTDFQRRNRTGHIFKRADRGIASLQP